MRSILILFLMGVMGVCGFTADEPKVESKSGPKVELKVPLIRLPKLVKPVKPVKPAEPTKAITQLDANTIYVVEADVECIIKQFVPNLVTIVSDEGPIRIHGRFVDDSSKTQTRIYKSKYVYTILAAGTGTANLVIVPKGANKEDDVVMLTLAVSDGSGPRPPPTPDPDSDPDKNSSPFPADGLRVLIIYPNQPETKLPAAQQLILSGQKTRDLLESSCVVGEDGRTKEYRIWRENERIDLAQKLWRDVFGRKRDSVPWVLIGNGRSGFEGPLPASEEEFQKLVQKYSK